MRRDFLRDDRGVSTLIGAVLLLGFLVVLLSIYQAQFVPIQNKQVEFDHSIEVQDDMLEVRNAILSADTTGRSTFATVKLGPQYDSRVVGVNPPPPSGTLETAPPGNITVRDQSGSTVSDLCPTTDPIQTRTLRYSPGYNEYREAPTIVYENTVVYLDYGDETILLSDERLVEGTTVNINPLNTSLRETGIRRVSVEPRPGLTRTKNVEGANVTYPTGLSQATWRDLLAEDLDPSRVTVTDGRLSINTSGEVAVSCAPLGLNEAPPGGSRVGAGTSINPSGPDDVKIRGFNRASQDVVEVTFNNTGSADTNITEARISFYNNPSDTGGDIGPIDLIDQNGQTVLRMEILGGKEPVDPEIRLPGNETETTLEFENTGGEKLSQDDFFIVEFTFTDGRQGTYFVDVPQ
jgi:hypothetical protein